MSSARPRPRPHPRAEAEAEAKAEASRGRSRRRASLSVVCNTLSVICHLPSSIAHRPSPIFLLLSWAFCFPLPLLSLHKLLFDLAHCLPEKTFSSQRHRHLKVRPLAFHNTTNDEAEESAPADRHHSYPPAYLIKTRAPPTYTNFSRTHTSRLQFVPLLSSRSMSSQKSALPIHTTQDPHNNVHNEKGQHEHISLDLDPYAPSNVYYGADHGPRKVAKSRTYSAVSNALAQSASTRVSVGFGPAHDWCC